MDEGDPTREADRTHGIVRILVVGREAEAAAVAARARAVKAVAIEIETAPPVIEATPTALAVAQIALAEATTRQEAVRLKAMKVATTQVVVGRGVGDGIGVHHSSTIGQTLKGSGQKSTAQAPRNTRYMTFVSFLPRAKRLPA